MTQQDTNQLKFEIKRFVDVIGFNWLNCNWLDKLSPKAKNTLNEYFFDAKRLSKAQIAGMLYKNQDNKLWNIIMER